MTSFRRGQRVVVADPQHHLYQRRGTVVQVREADGAGRIRIERGLPPGQSIVLEGIEYRDETILFPGHCELAR